MVIAVWFVQISFFHVGLNYGFLIGFWVGRLAEQGIRVGHIGRLGHYS